MPKCHGKRIDVYAPNLNDPRTLRRIQRALAFCDHFLKRHRELRLHHDKIANIFGNRGNALTEWLKTRLLIQCRGYSPGNISYAYRLNPYGYAKISSVITGRAVVEAVLDDKIIGEIQRLEFAYKGESEPYRIWHPLQSLNREKKGEFWTARGLKYNYDIVAALPSILYQSAIQFGAEPKRMTGLKSLIDDPGPFRTRFASVGNVTYGEAKDCINSMFYGATISSSPFSSFGQKIRGEAIVRLQVDPPVRSLNWAIKYAWRKIEQASSRMSRSERAYYYFREERRVLEVMRRHLNRSGNRHFCEHDGLLAEKSLNIGQVQQEILLATGYTLKLALKH